MVTEAFESGPRPDLLQIKAVLGSFGRRWFSSSTTAAGGEGGSIGAAWQLSGAVLGGRSVAGAGDPLQGKRVMGSFGTGAADSGTSITGVETAAGDGASMTGAVEGG